MYILENSYLKAAFNDMGSVCELVNKSANFGNIINIPAENSFRMVFVKDNCFENVINGNKQNYSVKLSDNKIDFITDKVYYNNGQCDSNIASIKVTLTVMLQGEDLIFTSEIINDEDVLITDFEYPCIGMINSLGDGLPALLMPVQCGNKYNNICNYIANDTSREAWAGSVTSTYPGFMSMQWIALTDKSQTLFFEGNDGEFYSTVFRCCRSLNKSVTLVLDKIACVKQGQTRVMPPLKLKLYSGDWHYGADDYKVWMSQYRPKHHVPDWIRDMTGYFLVINKQQFGYEMWNYDKIPELYEYAVKHGCSAVGLFGWFDSGHDNQYPDLKVSESLGGEEALKAGIKKLQEMGGHVTLYYQGYLIDINSPFYKNGGSEYTMKNIWGTEYIDSYNKAHSSQFLRHYTHKTFALACPSTEKWRVMMLEREKWIQGFGADGILYDQIGGMPPMICFDKNHCHDDDNPSFAVTHGRQKFMGAIQDNSKLQNSEFAFMSEHITDLYSGYLDALHGLLAAPSRIGSRFECEKNESRCECLNYPELFRYCFPETVITVRNAAPYMSKQFVNYAAAYGLRHELEIRYQADKDDLIADKWPELREYAEKAAALRVKYKDLLLRGVFTDTKHIVSVNPAVMAKSFTAGDKLAVVLWNDTSAEQSTLLTVEDGYKFICAEKPDCLCNTVPESLSPEEIAVAVYSK